LNCGRRVLEILVGTTKFGAENLPRDNTLVPKHVGDGNCMKHVLLSILL